MAQFENHFKRIDEKMSKILKDIPYLLIFTEKSVYRIYFMNLNHFKSYNNGKEYKCDFFELFDIIPSYNKLFLGVGNYTHISHMVPNLLFQKTKEKIITHSLRINGKLFKALDKIPFIDYFCFEREKICLLYHLQNNNRYKISNDYKICEI